MTVFMTISMVVVGGLFCRTLHRAFETRAALGFVGEIEEKLEQVLNAPKSGIGRGSEAGRFLSDMRKFSGRAASFEALLELQTVFCAQRLFAGIGAGLAALKEKAPLLGIVLTGAGITLGLRRIVAISHSEKIAMTAALNDNLDLLFGDLAHAIGCNACCLVCALIAEHYANQLESAMLRLQEPLREFAALVHDRRAQSAQNGDTICSPAQAITPESRQAAAAPPTAQWSTCS